MAVQTQIQARRGTAATWTSTNPTLAAGETGYETDTGKFKIGTGSTAWASLGYFNQDPVTTKGDLFTFSTTDARLAVGNNGEGLVADSTATTGLRWQGDYAAGKNLVINGNQNVSQRGTSFTSNASNINIYTTDRFQARNSALGEYTITQETDAPAGFGNSAKWLCTTAAASPAASAFLIYRTKFEGQQLQALQYGTATAQTTTLSFWVKSNLTGTFICQLFTEAPSSRNISASYTINAAATWEKKTITFVGDTVGVLTTGTNLALNVNWFLGAGSNKTAGSLQTTWAATSDTGAATGQTNLGSATSNYWQITGVQWEIGNTGTSFQLATGTIQGELAACQRYYFRNSGASTNDVILGFSGVSGSTTTPGFIFQPPVTMRVKPTSVDFANLQATDLTAGYALSALAIQSASQPNVIYITATSAILVAFRPLGIVASAASAYLGFSAELQEMKMDNVTFITIDGNEHALIDHGNNEFTSMLKLTYEAQQAALSTPSLPA